MKNDLILLYLVMLIGKIEDIKCSHNEVDILYSLVCSKSVTKGKFCYTKDKCEITRNKEILEYWIRKFLSTR